MKTTLLLTSFLFASFLSFSQRSGDLVFFSNTGEQFYVILNGVKQNTNPETNVKVDGLMDNYYSCKILSGQQKFDIDKNVMVKMDTLITYHIVEKKGKYKLRFYSERPFDNTIAPNQTVITYHPTEIVESQNNTNTGAGTKTNTGTNTTTTTTTTTGGNNSNSQTTSFGMGVTSPTETSTENIEIKINTTETGGMVNGGIAINENNSTSTSTTTTSSTTSTTVNGATTSTSEESSTTTVNGGVTENTYSNTTSTNTGETTMYQDPDMAVSMGTNTTGACSSPMNTNDFANAKKSVSSKTFTDSKMTVAKQVVDANCLTAAQIKELAMQFDFEEDKLTFAKYAYLKCYDKNNYAVVNDVFEFDSSIEALDSHISANR